MFVSAASACEIATKFRLGRLPDAAAVATDIGGAIASQSFLPLEISVLHAQRRAAGRIFEIAILMYGKEPGLREMMQWLRVR